MTESIPPSKPPSRPHEPKGGGVSPSVLQQLQQLESQLNYLKSVILNDLHNKKSVPQSIYVLAQSIANRLGSIASALPQGSIRNLLLADFSAMHAAALGKNPTFLLSTVNKTVFNINQIIEQGH